MDKKLDYPITKLLKTNPRPLMTFYIVAPFLNKLRATYTVSQLMCKLSANCVFLLKTHRWSLQFLQLSIDSNVLRKKTLTC